MSLSRPALGAALALACAGPSTSGQVSTQSASAQEVLPPSAPALEQPMKPSITEITEGLRPEHIGARPLLDRVENQGRGRVQVRRTYADGAQYLLTRDPSKSGPPAWTPFVAITPAGVAQIQRIVAEEFVQKTPAPPPPAGPSSGRGGIVWVAYLEEGERIVETGSGNYDALPGFVRRLDEAVSLNPQRAE